MGEMFRPNPYRTALVGAIFLWSSVAAAQVDDRDAYLKIVEILSADVANDPSDAEAWFGLSIAHMYLGQFDEAREATVAAEAADPTDPRFPDQLGEVYVALDRPGDAIAAFERAVGLDPGLYFAHQRLGSLYLDTGRTVPAIEHLEIARSQRDWDWETRRMLGLAYFRDGQIENALAEYREALRLAPAEEVHYLELADVYFTASMTDEARGILEEALRLFPDSAQAMLGLARLHTEAGELPEAIGRFRSALATGDPTLPLASIHKSMGDVYRDLLEPDQAVAAYLRAVDADPEAVGPRLALAEIYTQQNRLDDARSAYARAAALDPSSAEAHAGLASVALLVPDAAQALESADRALELDPAHRQALYFRAQALILLGEREEGRRSLDAFARAEAAAQAEEQRTRELQAMNREALDELDAGRVERAIALLGEAIGRFPGEQLLYANLAAAYSQSGRHEEAARTFEAMIDRGLGDAITHLRLSWELDALGDREGSAAERAIYEGLRAGEGR